MSVDHFHSLRVERDSPTDDNINVVPSDADELEFVSRALYLHVGGDIKVTLASGRTETFTLASGWHPWRVKQVWSTGTTATGIIAGR